VGKARNWRRKSWLRWLKGVEHGAEAAGVALGGSRIEERVDARLRIDALMRKLPASQREVLVLHVIEGLSALETAEALGISENAVATRLHRARKVMQ